MPFTDQATKKMFTEDRMWIQGWVCKQCKEILLMQADFESLFCSHDKYQLNPAWNQCPQLFELWQFLTKMTITMIVGFL